MHALQFADFCLQDFQNVLKSFQLETELSLTWGKIITN